VQKDGSISQSVDLQSTVGQLSIQRSGFRVQETVWIRVLRIGFPHNVLSLRTKPEVSWCGSGNVDACMDHCQCEDRLHGTLHGVRQRKGASQGFQFQLTSVCSLLFICHWLMLARAPQAKRHTYHVQRRNVEEMCLQCRTVCNAELSAMPYCPQPPKHTGDAKGS
jgi:hypothetical protein